MLLLWLWNAWESWGWMHWIWFTHLLRRFMDDSWSGFSEIFLYSFIFFRALFLLLPLILDIHPWYASIFSSLPERDPRKSGVVVIAVKLTPLASPYPSFFYPPLFLGRHTHFLTQASISRQPIPILHATHNYVLPSGCLTPGILLRHHFHPGVSHPDSFNASISIRVSRTRNPSPLPFPFGCLAPGILPHCHFHPDVLRPKILSARRSTFSRCPTSGILSRPHSLLRVSYILNSHP